MNAQSRLAIVGAGASAIYVLQHLLRQIDTLSKKFSEIHILEREQLLGTGMPYSPKTTDRYNLCNISSAEIPTLPQSLVAWLKSLDDAALSTHGIARQEIDDAETYSRLALGDYFQAQYAAVRQALQQAGMRMVEHAGSAVTDIVEVRDEDTVRIQTAAQDLIVGRVIIATGHAFHKSDEPDSGYFASPWPMHKLLPEEGGQHNFAVGTLGASLSAFDVVASLANRHGSFHSTPHGLRYQPSAEAPEFRFVMHSAEGWLPHLQYEQEEAFREIYRHASREQMLGLRDTDGLMSLDDYFDQVCRPALMEAFLKDQRPDLVSKLQQSEWALSDFVAQMTGEHEYDDPFAGMRQEMPEAENSLKRGQPIHWKEVLDDLMFTLNFHFDWLSAEDTLVYRRTVTPFLMNVIAAMPLQSAQTLLALADAGRLELVPGRVTIKEKLPGKTVVTVDNEGELSEHTYRMFVDCSGQGTVDIDQFPFPSLVTAGTVSPATARFRSRRAVEKLSSADRERVIEQDDQLRYELGGIAIDGCYRVVGKDGQPSPRIFDIAFPHATGVRPYSYGLQACDITAAIVIEALCATAADPSTAPPVITQVYEDLPKAS